MKVIIDRTKWYRGQGSIGSSLLRPTDQKMCCVGFFGKACNINDDNCITEVKREAKLTQLFAIYGIELEFIKLNNVNIFLVL